jgi:leucyl-tRNA synthetase
MSAYDFKAIESRWQSHWAQHRTFATPNPGDKGFDPSRPKFYVLDMFPYPSGVGLHVGHPLGYIATDIVARYKRMNGFNVLHPMGFDAFGLPAEQFAVEHGVHPRVTTEQNVANMVRQLKRLGLSYDWDRAISTTDVPYYRWTQWIFLQLYNSYFDPVAQAAQPIVRLQRMLENGELFVTVDGDLVPAGGEGLTAIEGAPVGSIAWHELSPIEQQEILAEHRLAYLAEVPVNWCPALGTVLANEEVTNDGRSERGNHPVFKRPLKQWMLRITAYAQRLLGDLDLVDWPEPIKLMQRNWIGRSEGASVKFRIAESDEAIEVFTTRPDTLFGATYLVLAPEHPLVTALTTPAHAQAVARYQALAQSRSDIDRQAESREKTGVFTGSFAINPVNGESIPIWIADYVLMGYGTGAIMAVPAHDERDFAFAKTFKLPIRAVVTPDDAWLAEMAGKMGETGALVGGSVDVLRSRYLADAGVFAEAFTGQGVAVNSASSAISLDTMPTVRAKRSMTTWLESAGIGKGQVQYKLRDWLFSRQRYWGEPFPILHGPGGEIRAVEETRLPVELPPMDDFSPEASDDPTAPPRPPLARAPESWRYVEIDGVRYERELNTMPQWAGSCWYYLRFIDPRNEGRFVDELAEQYWMGPNGIDLYVGGAEHAVLHLLYSRFWHKVLFDLGHVSTPEPFGRLFNQGYIQAYAYQDERGIYVPATEIEQRDGSFFHNGKPVTRTLGKMGKSLKNAVSPDEMAEQYGTDTLRLYEMYMGPLDASKPWETRDIVGLHRFLQRVWRNFIAEDDTLRITDEAADDATLRLIHKTTARVTEHMDALRFNTAIAELIKLNNELVGRPALPRLVADAMVRMLAPLAPHMAEELWHRMGHKGSISAAGWPTADAAYLVDDEVEIVVQISGKVRGKITVPADADNGTVERTVLTDDRIMPLLAGKSIKKVVVVPGRLVNIVAV